MLTNAILVIEESLCETDVLIARLSSYGLTGANFLQCSLADISSEKVSKFSPDFIFVDINIGFHKYPPDTFLYVQEKFSTLPIVVFSEINDNAIATTCIQAGAQNFLVKGSYNPEQIYTIVTHATEKNNLRQELKRLRIDYQALFDNNAVPMLVVNPKTKRFIAANKAAKTKYGYSEEEFLELTLADIEGNEKPTVNNVENTNSCPPNYETHYKKNGERLFVELEITDTIYKNTPAILITVNDVTSKVKAAEDEKKANQRLDSILNGTNDAVLLVDEKGNYVQVNPAACKMFGYTQEEFLQMNVSSLLDYTTTAKSKKKSGSQFLDSVTGSSIVELKRKDGATVICHYNGVANILPGLHVSILTDITERETARIKIVEQGTAIQNILESITDCFISFDKQWIVTYWNKATEKLLKHNREEVLGKNIWSIFPNANKFKLYDYCQKAMNEKVQAQFEEYFPNAEVWVDFSVFPTEDGVTIYIRNITDVKRRANEILESKNNQAALINSTKDLIWSIDANLRLLSFNAAYAGRIESTAGFTPYEGLKLPVQSAHAPGNPVNWEQYYKKALQGEAFSVDEVFLDPKSGTMKRAEVTFNPIYSVNGKTIKGVACYSHDITQRIKYQMLIEEQNAKLKSNEEYLQKISGKLKKVLDSSLDVICSVDSAGNFVQVSEASRSVWGYSPEELIGTSYFSLVDSETLDATVQAAKGIIEGKSINNFENVSLHKDGTPKPMMWSANWDEEEQTMFCVARDASSIVAAEKLKSQSQERIASLLQKGADMVGIIDQSANYTYVSPNVKSILGYEVDELLKINAMSIIHPDDLSTTLEKLQLVLSGEEVRLTAFRFKHASGEWRWMETVATNQIDNPAINGIVINSRDITTRKQIENERELMIKELLKSNADLKQFSFITSHNLRAPLSNIIGILNIVDYDSLTAYNREMLKMMDTSAKQLGQTIDDLAKILIIKNNINTEITEVDVEESFKEVNKIFLNTLNDFCSRTITDFRVKQIPFNKTYFESILVNLISNSIKYRSEKRNLVITIASYRDGSGNTILKFCDNGTGIDLRRHKNHVFGLYQRFHDKSEGQGLGLFIIKSQIVALGGKIEVDSEPDNGTTFTITFRNQSHFSPPVARRELAEAV